MIGGGIAMAICMILIVPVGTMLVGALWSLLVGSSLWDDAETRAHAAEAPGAAAGA